MKQSKGGEVKKDFCSISRVIKRMEWVICLNYLLFKKKELKK